MSVIATFSVDGTDFAIGAAFETLANVSITVEPVVPVSVGLAPYVWLEGETDASTLATFRADDRVAAATVVDRLEDRRLFSVDWHVQDDEFIDAIADTGAVVLDAGRESGETWSFQLRFDNYDSLSTFNRRCLDQGIELELEQVHNPAGAGTRTQMDLTPGQHEVLLAAIEGGYFEVPRETTLVELGEQLDISDSAVSQRLRRGLRTLLSRTLPEREDGVD